MILSKESSNVYEVFVACCSEIASNSPDVNKQMRLALILHMSMKQRLKNVFLILTDVLLWRGIYHLQSFCPLLCESLNMFYPGQCSGYRSCSMQSGLLWTQLL